MKNIFLLFVFSIVQLSGQIKFKSNFTVPNTPLQLKELGKNTHNFYYKVKFSTDENSVSKREAICLLQVGEKGEKFFDYNQLRKDSVTLKYNHKETLDARDVQELLKIRVLWSNVVVKVDDKLTVQDRFVELYEYDEKTPKFNWKLEDGAKEILGYNCNKATVEYGGRTYTAWYTKNIPINSGPYKFEGLPGLILEIYDSNNDFNFKVIAMDNNPIPIYIRKDEKIFLVSKEKFRTIQLSYYENPGFFHGTAYSADGKELNKSSNKLPYNLIELK